MGGFKFMAAFAFLFGFVLRFLIGDMASVFGQTFVIFDFSIASKLAVMVATSLFLGWLARG